MPRPAPSRLIPLPFVFVLLTVLVEPSAATTPDLGEDVRDVATSADDAILFSSARDGDLELSPADTDGSTITRITRAPGVDAEATWSPDGTHFAWVAARPRGRALAAYRSALAEGRVDAGAPTEVWLADADGADRRRLTDLGTDARSPMFTEDGRHVTFRVSTGPRAGQWIVGLDGAGLARIDGAVEPPRAADRIAEAIQWLAADEREGRGIGTDGLRQAEHWLAERFAELGLRPAGSDGFFHAFEVPTAVVINAGTEVAIDGELWSADGWTPAAFSGSGQVEADVVVAGHGITAPELQHDDYEGVDATGKIVVVRRFVPTGARFEDESNQRRFGDLRYKAFNAREQGAIGVVIVDLPADQITDDEAPLPDLSVETQGDAGLPVVIARRALARSLFDGTPHRVRLDIRLESRTEIARNVVARLPAGSDEPIGPPILIGAHFDHLGFGGEGTGSLSPDDHAVHNGADDNASGTAALIEIARELLARRTDEPSTFGREVVFAAFSAEESGLLGSAALVREPPPDLVPDALGAMLNLDMIGRMRDGEVQVLGAASAEEWAELVPPSCRIAELDCRLGGDGYGPSDQTSFYAVGVPVLHWFTGTHDDYHRPSDDAAEVNALGVARVATAVADVVAELGRRTEPLTYVETEAPGPSGDMRSFGASLGTIPDYAGTDRPGVPLSGARPGSAADRAGVRKGDLIVELGGKTIRNIYDFVFVLRSAKPGETTTLVVERHGERVALEITYDQGRRRP
ncbi:MAG: M28 family peptidase [Acidobacteriota bacterium]